LQRLQRVSQEPLEATVAFGLPDEGRARADADRAEFVPAVVGEAMDAAVVAAGRAVRGTGIAVLPGGRDGFAATPDGADAGSANYGLHDEELSAAVVDQDAEGRVALTGRAAGGVDGPTAVGSRLPADRPADRGAS
jgi:hypothetical protein